MRNFYKLGIVAAALINICLFLYIFSSGSSGNSSQTVISSVQIPTPVTDGNKAKAQSTWKTPPTPQTTRQSTPPASQTSQSSEKPAPAPVTQKRIPKYVSIKDLPDPAVIWRQSDAWAQYLIGLKAIPAEYNGIKNNDDYCTQEPDLGALTYVFTDYETDSPAYKALAARTDVVLLESEPDLQPEIGIFMLEDPWFQNRKVGQHFMCDNQRMNQIVGQNWLIYADRFIELTQDFQKEAGQICFDLSSFMPESLIIHNKKDCLAAMEYLKGIRASGTSENISWVWKSARDNETQPITPEVASILLEKYQSTNCELHDGREYVMQKWIKNKLTLDNRDFSVKIHVFMASMNPAVVLFAPFAVSHPDKRPEKYLAYEELYARLDSIEQKKIERQFKMKAYQTIAMSFNRLLPHPGMFQVFELDFVIDSGARVYLVNVGIPSERVQDLSNSLETKLQTLYDDVLSIELALATKENTKISEAIEESGFEVLMDGRLIDGEVTEFFEPEKLKCSAYQLTVNN